MRRAVVATFALVLVTGAKCRRDEQPATAIVDAAPEASTVASVAPPKVEAPARPSFRRFDPASTFLRQARMVGGGLTLGDVKAEPLGPEQVKKAEEIARELAESDRAPEAIATLRADLAAGLRKGRFDEAKLRADREALVRDMQPVFDGEVNALSDLHALLTPLQREHATLTSRIGRLMHNVGHVTTDTCRKWTKDLPIDAAKKKQVDAAVPAPQVLVQSFDMRLADVANAFAKESFDARTFDTLDPKKKAVLPLDVEGEFLRKIAPLLDEESRKIVAERFEKEDLKSFRD